MEGGKGLAMAGAIILSAPIALALLLSTSFLIAFYMHPKSWKVIVASILNLIGIFLYYLFEFNTEPYFRYIPVLFYLLLLELVFIVASLYLNIKKN